MSRISYKKPPCLDHPSVLRVVFSAVICNRSQVSALACSLARSLASRRSSIEKCTMMVSNAGESAEYGGRGHRHDRII